MKKFCLVWKCRGLRITAHVNFILANDEEEAKAVADKIMEYHSNTDICTHYKYYIENIIEITDDKFLTMEKVELLNVEMKKLIENPSEYGKDL